MVTMTIEKSVFFEHIIPDDFGITAIAVKATQARLSLEDALNHDEYERAARDLKTYKTLFDKLLKTIYINKSSMVLKAQPLFEWSWANGNEKYMSPCWLWENLMLHAAGNDVHVKMSMVHAEKDEWKLANKHLSISGRYSATISQKILPKWTWKEDQSICMTFADFWTSKLQFIHGTKHLCTPKYAYSTENGISNTNVLKFLNQIETHANSSILLWSNKDNTELMNWCRVFRAYATARKYAEKDEYGKSIGMVNKWSKPLAVLKSKQNLCRYLNAALEEVDKITEEKKEWIQTNDHLHYLKIEAPELQPPKNLENNIISLPF